MTPLERIDYAKIAKAVEYYTDRGYQHVEVPWVVDAAAVQGAIPAHVPALEVVERYALPTPLADYTPPIQGCLVGSAEQGFMQMFEEGRLEPGRYVAVSPCFRPEPKTSNTHRLWFMKVELCHYFGKQLPGDAFKPLIALLRDAFNWMYTEVPSIWVSRTGGDDDVATDAMFDIMADSKEPLELGSYGYRNWNGHWWVYGTGLAEPRLSIAQLHHRLTRAGINPEGTIHPT